MNRKDIIKIAKVDNVRIQNTHDGRLFPLQSVLEIETREGERHIIDLIADRDITYIDYYVVVQTPKTKERILFKEFEG
ncbi:MAG: hypothetical protein J6T15_03895 [Bacilli bacterium]|nr:hypothetical protein [Bacilli bacterium]